jgi:hypothetical protein
MNQFDKIRKPEIVSPVENLTLAEKLQLEACFAEIKRLEGITITNANLASVLAVGDLLKQVQPQMDKIDLSISFQSLIRALKQDKEVINAHK